MKLLKQLKIRNLLGGLSLLILISAGYLGMSSFKDYLRPIKIDILTSGYPRAFFFRRSVTLITPGYENWEKTFNRLGGIMVKI